MTHVRTNFVLVSLVALVLAGGTPCASASVPTGTPPAVSDAVRESARRTMAHDFTVCGFRYRFPGAIDWEHNPTYNNYREWPWQFARFNFLPNLAAYYRATRDPQAAACFVDLVGGFIDRAKAPPAGTGPGATKSWRTLDTGLRASNWIRAWPAFERAPEVTPAFRGKVLASLREHIARLRPCRTFNNWRVMELGGLVDIVFQFPDLDADGAILRGAEAEFRNVLATQLHPDGFSFELAPGYHGILPDVFGALGAKYRARGLRPPADLEQGLELAYELYPHLARPDGKLPDVNDSGLVAVRGPLTRAVRLFPQRTDFRWFASGGRDGAPPPYLSYAFPYAGAVVFRSAWTRDAVWGYVDMGPYGYAHQHEDKLNFLLFAYGKEMLTEGGIYDYDTSEMRRYVLSTRSHNTIRIDGADQCAGATEGAGRYMTKNAAGQSVVNPVVLATKADLRFETTPARDVASAAFTNGYRAVGQKRETAVTHRRTVEFVKNEGVPYFRITDELTATDDREHTYEQLWHLETCSLTMREREFTADFGDGVTLRATFACENGRLEDRMGRKTPQWQGWKPIRPYGDHEHRPIHTPTLCGRFRGTAKIVVEFRPLRAARLAEACDRGWAKMMETWDPATSLVTGVRDKSKSPPPPDAKNNLYPMYDGRPGGWGPPGVGDAPLICGTALSGLVDKWAVTHDPSVRADAAKLARGVLNLAILHGYRGFVCRGFCNDGKTTVSLSSRDQYTHWVHGLWRYCTSPMADARIVRDYTEQIVAVAQFMEARVTPEHQWNFGYADDASRPDYRTICTMWGPEVWPHEAARLPMIYAAAHMATGDGHWRALYESLIDAALDITLKVKYGGFKGKTKQQIQGRMPCYSLYQCVTSFELIAGYEKDPKRLARIREAVAVFAGFARERQLAAQRDRRVKPYGMCWDGELLLTQLMDPGFRPDESFRAFLERAVFAEPLERAGLCRTAHILAAYWRARLEKAYDSIL